MTWTASESFLAPLQTTFGSKGTVHHPPFSPPPSNWWYLRATQHACASRQRPGLFSGWLPLYQSLFLLIVWAKTNNQNVGRGEEKGECRRRRRRRDGQQTERLFFSWFLSFYLSFLFLVSLCINSLFGTEQRQINTQCQCQKQQWCLSEDLSLFSFFLSFCLSSLPSILSFLLQFSILSFSFSLTFKTHTDIHQFHQHYPVPQTRVPSRSLKENRASCLAHQGNSHGKPLAGSATPAPSGYESWVQHNVFSGPGEKQRARGHPEGLSLSIRSVTLFPTHFSGLLPTNSYFIRVVRVCVGAGRLIQGRRGALNSIPWLRKPNEWSG